MLALGSPVSKNHSSKWVHLRLKLIRLVIVHTLSKYLIMHLKLELEHVPKCFVKMFGVNNVNIRLSPEVGSIMKMSIYDAI